LDRLVDLLDLEQIEVDIFRGKQPTSEPLGIRVFGGQVAGQALVAAGRTVAADRPVHSLHSYFLRPGDPSVPIVYEVDRIRDGRSFTTRRVVAIQRGQAIFSLEASFQVEETGLDHQFPIPLDVPRPETLKSQRELLDQAGERVPENIRKFWARERPLELKPANVEHYTSRDRLPPRQNVWLRALGKVPDDRGIQAAVLAYLSDMTLLDTSTFAHGRSGFDPDIQMASLDHSIWFHRAHPLDGWLLYSQDSPSASGSRGFSRGMLYGEDGTLIASTAQEGLVRLRSDSRSR
jgi:acyl-CoA thioesterase-2